MLPITIGRNPSIHLCTYMLSRYYTYSQFESYFSTLIRRFKIESLEEIEIGKSVLGKSIYGLKLGTGSTKILAWSQMHGNESTTTRALCQLLESVDIENNLNSFKLYIIPILNPDGAESWTRVNANNVDLNRDAMDLSQPESTILRKVINDYQPDYCLNLHGQRTIYGSLDGKSPVQMSFLAPAGDKDRKITEVRLKSMNVINHIYSQLKNKVNGIIGRYDDAFNINCVGDYLTSVHIPTILFEAGHSGSDYSRDEVTYLVHDSLVVALNTINDGISQKNTTLRSYEDIPAIASNFTDVLIKNYPSKNGFTSLYIQYHEQINANKLYFVPILIGLNRKDILNAHEVIDLSDVSTFENDLVIDENLEVYSESLNIKIFTN
ncbi:zinc carboxypeptidase [Nonlabens dokdonensis]|uniref:Peptidase, family M14 n=2 Tax=Nonlabens dokdonensis TaxID=328515 RepID=L7WCY7_NONDD|nr:M14 family zinc carboxypeptidase [Nonlabens dokdonensis]AGC78112.1 peptidase, family M14 [Nonlabens dokdonensis DSW-6]PZX37173.1 zinc carboxypeptidase [Nonlabens dokdonensis]